ATSATFTVSTPGFVSGPVTLSASFGGVSVTSTLTVNVLQLNGLALNPPTVNFDFEHVIGGAGLQGVVTMNTAPTSPVVVQLGSSDANVAHPVSGTVTIPAGATSATFDISTAPVAATSVVEISAAFERSPLTIPLAVTPPLAPATLLLSPANVVGSGTAVLTVVGPASSTGTVTLTAPAPAGGAVVILSTVDFATGLAPGSSTVPGSITIPAG